MKAKQEQYKEVVEQYDRRRPGVDDPVKKEAQEHIEKLNQKLADKRAKVQASLEERLRSQAKANFDKSKAEYDASGPILEKPVARLTKEEEQLRKEIETLGKEADKFGRSSSEFEMLKAEVAREAQFVDDLGKNRDLLRVEQRRPPRVTIFQEAALQKHDLKRQVLAAICAAVAGLFLAGFAVAWLECRARRIHTADEVTTGLGLRVVGAVPPSAPNVLRLATANGQALPDEHHFLESIDGIRTMLLRDARSS